MVDRIVGSVIRVHVASLVRVQVGFLDVLYKRVRIAVSQFGTRSVLAQNFLVMEFVHCFFLSIPKYKSPDRSVDRQLFLVSVSNRYKIFCDDVPMERGGSSYELLCASRICYQFEVLSFT